LIDILHVHFHPLRKGDIAAAGHLPEAGHARFDAEAYKDQMTDDRWQMTEKDLRMEKDSLFKEVTAERWGFGDHGAEHEAHLLLQLKRCLFDPQISKDFNTFRHIAENRGQTTDAVW
jgi:hypothetical protein